MVGNKLDLGSQLTEEDQCAIQTDWGCTFLGQYMSTHTILGQCMSTETILGPCSVVELFAIQIKQPLE